MISLFTNVSAQNALQTLTNASKSLSATQNRVSTGYRINTAEDNAAYWSIATTLRSDVVALSAVGDVLGQSAAQIDTVYAGINDTKDLLDQIKSKLVAASESGIPRSQAQAEIAELQNRLKDVARSTTIDSETWLAADSSNGPIRKEIAGSFTRAGGAVHIDTVTLDLDRSLVLIDTSHVSDTRENGGLLDSTAKAGVRGSSVLTMDITRLDAYKDDTAGLVSSTASDAEVLAALLAHVDATLDTLTLSAGAIGAIRARVDGNVAFVKNLLDANNRGIGQLVDADLNEESSKLKALQTQEQLAIQALSIANNSSQNTLRLFQ